jgi:hypothetical protein
MGKKDIHPVGLSFLDKLEYLGELQGLTVIDLQGARMQQGQGTE